MNLTKEQLAHLKRLYLERYHLERVLAEHNKEMQAIMVLWGIDGLDLEPVVLGKKIPVEEQT